MRGQTLQKAFVPLADGAVAVYTSSGLAFYRHKEGLPGPRQGEPGRSDWLGSSRFASTPTRTMYSDEAYAPFGEPYAQSGTADLSFTGMNQDTVSGLYDFPAREYATEGRWPSPDPAGIGSVYSTDPQTWNRYAYVRNTPTQLFDPTGMVIPPPVFDMGGGGACVWDDGSYDASDDPMTGSMDACNALGGTWDTSLEGTDWNSNPNPYLAAMINFLQNAPNVAATQPPECQLSIGQRISIGIQGTLNTGIGSYKAIKGAVATFVGLGLAPESGGLSLPAAAGGAYLMTTGVGQSGTGVSQLQRAVTGNGGPETKFEQRAVILSGPISGFAVLGSGFSMEDAERAANFESIITVGTGVINSSKLSEGIQASVDAGLALMGVASSGGCKME